MWCVKKRMKGGEWIVIYVGRESACRAIYNKVLAHLKPTEGVRLIHSHTVITESVITEYHTPSFDDYKG